MLTRLRLYLAALLAPDLARHAAAHRTCLAAHELAEHWRQRVFEVERQRDAARTAEAAALDECHAARLQLASVLDGPPLVRLDAQGVLEVQFAAMIRGRAEVPRC